MRFALVKCESKSKFRFKKLLFTAVTGNQMGFITSCFLISHQIFCMLMIDVFHVTCICVVKLLWCFGPRRYAPCYGFWVQQCFWVWHPMRWGLCLLAQPRLSPRSWWQPVRHQLPSPKFGFDLMLIIAAFFSSARGQVCSEFSAQFFSLVSTSA